MRKTVRHIFTLVVTLLIVFFVVQKTTLFPSLQNIFKPKAVVVDQAPILVTQIKNIAQLMTVEAYNEVVVDSTRYPFGMPPQLLRRFPANPLVFLGSSQLVLIVKGKVIAGVDLKTLDSNAIQIHGDSLFVQLPRAAVLEVITNPSDVETFIERGDWDQNAATVLKVRARNRMVQQAVAQGALQQADVKARQIVYELLKNTGYRYVGITTAIQVNTRSGK